MRYRPANRALAIVGETRADVNRIRTDARVSPRVISVRLNVTQQRGGVSGIVPCAGGTPAASELLRKLRQPCGADDVPESFRSLRRDVLVRVGVA